MNEGRIDVRKFRRASNKSGCSIKTDWMAESRILGRSVCSDLKWSSLEETKDWTVAVIVGVETDFRIDRVR